MQCADAADLWPIRNTGKIEAEANLDVLLRQIVVMNQHLADLVSSVGVFALLRVTVLKHEVAVAAVDNRLGVGLDFVNYTEDLADLGVKRCLRAEEDIAVGVCAIVAVIYQFSVGADLVVVTGDELEEAQHGSLGHYAEGEGRGRVQQVLLDVLAEADKALLKVFQPSLPYLPDIEIDEAHREHVVGEEGELVFPVRVVGIKDVPQEPDILFFLRSLE